MQSRSQYIETIEIYPREKSSNEMNFVLPKRQGYLSADTRLIIPATCITKGYQYPPNVGVFSLFQSVTIMTESGGVIDQVNYANELYSNLNNLRSPEQRKRVDSVFYGINYSFEGGSGSKMDNTDSRQVLAGQNRMAGGKYEFAKMNVAGRYNSVPLCMSHEPVLTLETDINKTPEFSVTLSELFVGLFRSGNYQLPLALIDEEIMIQIIFSNNNGYGDNDRAIFCPALEDSSYASSIISLGVIQNAQISGFTDTNELVLTDSAQGHTGRRCKIMVDVKSNVLSNIQILDGGDGYNKFSELEFEPVAGWTSPLKCAPSHKLIDYEGDNDLTPGLMVLAGGDNFIEGNTYTLKNVTNPNLNIKITATDVVTDALRLCELVDNDVNINLAMPNGTKVLFNVYSEDIQDDGEIQYDDTGARVLCYSKYYENAEVDITDGNITNKVKCRNADSSIIFYYVQYVDVDHAHLYDVFGNLVEGDYIFVDAQDVQQGTLTILDLGDSENVMECYGIGFDPVYSFDSVADLDTGKININLDKVYMSTDIIYYLNGQLEKDKAIAETVGFSRLYTRFVDIVTTVTEDSAITEYGKKSDLYISRNIGMSNELIRSIMFGMGPSGTQDREKFPYYGLPKMNPLLNKYCSVSPLSQGGLEFQLIINSTPVYNEPVQTDSRAFTELNKCFGDVHIPRCMYSSWEACRQLDNVSVVNSTNPSLQPGFTTLDGWDYDLDGYKATKQYEINDRKMGACNQLYMGVPQKYNLGMNHYVGASFKYLDETSGILPNNGVISRNTPMEVRYTHSNTYNPLYSTPARMMIFCEVQRNMVIKNGLIEVTNALF